MTSKEENWRYNIARSIRPRKQREFEKSREYSSETCRKKCFRLLEEFGPYEPGVITNDTDAQTSQLTHLFDVNGTIRSQMAASHIATAFGIQLEAWDYSKHTPNDIVDWVKRELASQGRLLQTDEHVRSAASKSK